MYADQYALAHNVAFRARIEVAALTAARDVAGEAIGEMSEDVYAKRQALATKVINDPSEFAKRFAGLVATNPAITAESPDSDLQWTVNSLWGDVASVTDLD